MIIWTWEDFTLPLDTINTGKAAAVFVNQLTFPNFVSTVAGRRRPWERG